MDLPSPVMWPLSGHAVMAAMLGTCDLPRLSLAHDLFVGRFAT